MQLQTGQVAVSVVEYPEGGEIVASVQPLKQVERDQVKKGQGTSGRSMIEAARRAKAVVRRRARFYGLRFMVTLTFPGDGIHDYGQSAQLVERFIHDYGMLLHNGGAYVAVPEVHPSGHGFHWHILVGRKVKVDALRRRWTSFLVNRGWQRPIREDGKPGFVRVNVKRFGSRKAAAYAAKYLAKTFEENRTRPEGSHRYLTSKGHQVPVLKIRLSVLDQAVDLAEMIAPPGAALHVYDSRDEAGWSERPLIFVSW